MIELITVILAAAARMGTPIVLAAYGELLSERSGVLNLGTEGGMIMGAFTSFYVYLITDNFLLSLLVAMIAGAVMSSFLVVTSVWLRANQIVAGIGIWLLGFGMSGFLMRALEVPHVNIKLLESIKIPLLSEIPILGPAFFDQNVLVYTAFLLAPAIWLFLFKTSAGLRIRSVGENPKAATTVGVRVNLVRAVSVIGGGALVGLGGAALAHSSLATFIEGATAFRGFIAIAVVIFSGWNPFWVLGGGLLIGGVESIQMRIQLLGTPIPYRFLTMLPYIVPLVILLIMARRRRHQAPLALGQSFPAE